MSKRLYELIGRVMNVPVSQINDNSSPESIESWTSFNGYVLLYELEHEFNVKFTMEEAIDVKAVSDIKRHIRNHGIVLND